MNTKRVILAGFAAGLFLNAAEALVTAVVLLDDYRAVLETHSISVGPAAIGMFALGLMAFGFVVAWNYAAIRPRFGGGPKTGALAAVPVWVVGYLVPITWLTAMGLGLGAGMAAIVLGWGLCEFVVAGLLAGWVYRED